MKIEILGVGCPKCVKTFELVSEVVRQTGSQAEVVKVFDLDEIARYGVAAFPAIAVDGVLKSSGRMLSREDVQGLLQG